MMKQTSPAAKIFSWIFALFWLVVCLLPFTQLISVTFSTADRGIVSTFYPNSLSSGIENIKQALLQTNMSPSTLQTLIYLVRACTPEGGVVAEYVGPPAPHYRLEREEVIKRVNANIDACLAKFGGSRKECVYLVCGTTGLDTDRDQQAVDDIYKGLSGFVCPVLCVNDAQVAQFAVTGGVGAVVIAGTGSIAFGCNEKGQTARCGGWPPCIFGDEGSGSWISMRALNHLSLLMDGRARPSILSRMLNEVLHLERKEDLIGVCIDIEHMCWKNPGLARVVDQAAEQGDPYAVEILKEAARHTFSLGDAVVQQLHFAERPVFRVGAWGSAIVKSKLHFQFFQELFTEKYDNVEVLIAREDAAMGACRIAQARLKDAE